MTSMRNYRSGVSFIEGIVFWRLVTLELEVDFDVVAGCAPRLQGYVSKDWSASKHFDLVGLCSEVEAEGFEEGGWVGDVDDLAYDAGIVKVVRVRQKFKSMVELDEDGALG